MSIIQNILHYHLQLYFGEKKCWSNFQINILYKTFLNFMHLELPGNQLGKTSSYHISNKRQVISLYLYGTEFVTN